MLLCLFRAKSPLRIAALPLREQVLIFTDVLESHVRALVHDAVNLGGLQGLHLGILTTSP
jgi:hypothetical protein